MVVRLILGTLLSIVAFTVAGRRVARLVRLGRAGQPVELGRARITAATLRAELVEVLGQRRLLRWTVPGVAHALVFWGFLVLGLTLVEGYGALVRRDFHLPLIGTRPWLGFAEDLFTVATLAAVVVFAVIRVRHAPAREGRRSRFFGSHPAAGWIVLLMIFNVVWSLLLYRGAQVNTGNFPYASGAFASEAVARALHPLGRTANDVVETAGLLLALGIVLAFLVLVVYSKHLHILTAVPNIAFARRPRALGALLPVYSGGQQVDFDDPGEDDRIGRGAIEDFTWKGFLDFATCTECGRCQSQCPAWNTGKPLSPKLLVMGLRDHALARAPYLLDGVGDSVPLVATGGAVEPDALWACTTCGACVEQCPVDIEHVDHIVDMRRYQVLMEAAFPPAAGTLLRNLEHAGDPWGRGASARLEWTRDLGFDVPVVDGGPLPEDFEYLFWVGCAGAFEDRAKRTTRAVADLLHTAGVRYAVLAAETCTGDPARRIGNEMLFQQFAAQNVATLDAAGARRIVTTCAHCLNTLANEYPDLGGRYEVVHHTQLLATLVAGGRLTPVTPVGATVTYHDPCYLGRHNRVFAPPREILGSLPGTRLVEPARTRERSFCCGAGGARMWLEETIGTRINETRTDELLGTAPDVVAAACPYCVDMLADGVATRQQQGVAGADVEVADVAEVLLRSVRPASTPVPTNDPERAET
ncbi:(Fe-S)-binding protein [Virgisporangium ochraceum]